MKLYIVATPIGNLGDMTFRAVETLKEVDFIACEDTRVTIKLLNFFDIKKPMISYHKHNKRQKGEEICERLLNGESCALVSDAGTPAISDPGEDIVELCFERGIQVVPIPGASATVTALSVSGQPTGRFTFEGFLSQSKHKRNDHLVSLEKETRTMIFYEAPHKLKKTLVDLQKHFGNRDITICREITKKYEELIKTTLDGAIEHFNITDPKGEFVLILKGTEEEIFEVTEDLTEVALLEIEKMINEDFTLKDAVKKVSEAKKIPKNTLYNKALERFKG